jgi:hypothetical protein
MTEYKINTGYANLVNDATFRALCDRVIELTGMQVTIEQIAARLVRPLGAQDYKCYWNRLDERLRTKYDNVNGKQIGWIVRTACNDKRKNSIVYIGHTVYKYRAPHYTVCTPSRVTCTLCIDWLNKNKTE